MICAWKELLGILPPYLRGEVDSLGRTSAREVRLRLDQLPQLILQGNKRSFGRKVTVEDIHFVINSACRYSPWTAESAVNGYLTAPGGHRIGICGEVIQKQGSMAGFRNIRSLNIRVARDFPGIAASLANRRGNILLIGRPGSGKTTLLRDLIRQRAEKEAVAVVDERGELFPMALASGVPVDIITGCSKAEGIDVLLRTMGPDTIAVDEITAAEDCWALLQAGWCGVRLLATLHGASVEDLKGRAVYKPLVDSKLFDTLVILQEKQPFLVERMIP